MLTIKTKPDCTLGFVPMDIKFSPVTPESYDGEKVNPHHIDEVFIINADKSKIIGKLSEITEAQAMELVGGMECIYETYGQLPFLAPYGTEDIKGGGMKIYALHAIHSLQSAALSVGIQEKDFSNYLVIKI